MDSIGQFYELPKKIVLKNFLSQLEGSLINDGVLINGSSGLKNQEINKE